MSEFASKEAISKLHNFLTAFNDNGYRQKLRNIDCYPISAVTGELIGIDNVNTINYWNTLDNKKRNSIKNKQQIDQKKQYYNVNNENKTKEFNDVYYVAPRKGVDDSLDNFFKMQKNNNSTGSFNIIGIGNACEDTKVCEKCADNHQSHHCPNNYYICHMCGEKGHRMFQCKRAKCIMCFKLGHLANNCPSHKRQRSKS